MRYRIKREIIVTFFLLLTIYFTLKVSLKEFKKKIFAILIHFLKIY